ncbi:MAG: hypothetical protein ACPHDJ_07245, partial [Candidatus Puniceispirillaceae bacterium]
ERRQLSERFAFIKLEDVTGKLALAQIADRCWELKGKINVAITQACVVSGQPVESTFMIELEERFVDSFSDQTEIDAMEVDVDLLVNGEIPVGECLCQWIGVCAPAWPRAENFPILGDPELDNTENHPFARLSELKK